MVLIEDGVDRPDAKEPSRLLKKACPSSGDGDGPYPSLFWLLREACEKFKEEVDEMELFDPLCIDILRRFVA